MLEEEFIEESTTIEDSDPVPYEEQFEEIELGDAELIEEDDNELQELFDPQDNEIKEESSTYDEAPVGQEEEPAPGSGNDAELEISAEVEEIDYSSVLQEIYTLINEQNTLILDLNDNMLIIGKNHMLSEGLKVGFLLMILVGFVTFMILGRLS